MSEDGVKWGEKLPDGYYSRGGGGGREGVFRNFVKCQN